jgi:hypothetical protein
MNTEQADTATLSGATLVAEWERLKKKNMGMPKGGLLFVVHGSDDAMRRDIAKWKAEEGSSPTE